MLLFIMQNIENDKKHIELLCFFKNSIDYHF